MKKCSILQCLSLLMAVLMLAGAMASCKPAVDFTTDGETDDPATDSITETTPDTNPESTPAASDTVAESDSVTDTVTDPTIESTTDPETDPTTDPETDPTTDPETDPTTDPETDPTTDPETDPAETEPAETERVWMIEDFDNITDVSASLNPTDLSAYGIVAPQYSFGSLLAEDGKALEATLKTLASWCQEFKLTGDRMTAFANASADRYVRLWVSTPDFCSVSITVGVGAGSQKSYFDATQAILTDVNGMTVTLVTGNASGNGENSSVTIPAGFMGYVAFPLNARLGWGGNTSVTDLTAVDLVVIDVRPTNINENDRYVLDSLCIAENTANPARINANGDTNTMTKQEQLESMINAALAATPVYTYCPEYDPVGYPNVKAIWIDGVELNGRKTRVFAYIGFPEGADSTNPVPGIVLNHGGGGYAFPNWVDMWNQRGYAAIAIGNTGYYPAREGITDFYDAASWTHTLPLDMRNEYRIAPDNDGMSSSTGDIDRMWMYHAVTQTIFANSILRNDDRVITDKVGITGISWGGVITSITIGYDSRFAFAIPVYGSGYLYEALSWMKNNFNTPDTRELWDASNRLKDVTMPVYWIAWTNDTCFSINSNDKSFADTENGTLSFLMNWAHSHIHGWQPEEIYRFANSIVKGGEGLTTCTTQPSGGGNISFTIDTPADTTSVTAKVWYLTEKMTYTDGTPTNPSDTHIEQTWSSSSATVTGNTVTATIPETADSYYVEITTVCGGQSYITTSRYIVLQG